MAKRTTVPSRLLIVDRDARYGEWLRHHLGALFPDAEVCAQSVEDFARWSESVSDRECDVLLLAVSFGSGPDDTEAPGLAALRLLRERSDSPAVIAIAEDGNELTAVRALQLGAVDYLPKRLLTPERLKAGVRLALRRIERRVARRIANLLREGERGDATTTGARSGTYDALEQPGAESEVATAGGSAAGQLSGKLPTAAVTHGGEAKAADFIPGYTIHATLGESDKSAVYVATSTALGQNVALKISKALSEDDAGRQLLEREYKAIAAIRHRCVVQIHDYGSHAGYEYLAMEYLPRGDLKARMQKGMGELAAVGFVEQIAAALQVVHEAGLLHRDLKPPNVMLRENDVVALIDFGLARALDGSTPSTRTGVLRGSPYYMSPEQALGEQLDARSDFYSLGIIYFEMLTGRKPYTGSSAMDVLQQHVHAPVPQLPQGLACHARLLSKLLAKSREERFANAAELLAFIAVIREDLPQPPALAPDAASAA
ncbi:MAG TPA: protein kinase [Steroidobacteraceae bacterium]